MDRRDKDHQSEDRGPQPQRDSLQSSRVRPRLVAVKRDGKVVAWVTPAGKPTTLAQKRAAIARMRKATKGVRLNGLSIRAMREEGRR